MLNRHTFTVWKKFSLVCVSVLRNDTVVGNIFNFIYVNILLLYYRKHLKQNLPNHQLVLSYQEFLLRFKKYESSKLSYWRSEQRRRLLGIAGYDQLLLSPTNIVTDKILQLIGQKNQSTGTNRMHLQNEMIVARKYIRDISIKRAKKLKDFWSEFYTWKMEKWSNGMTMEDWQALRREDLI